MLNPGCSSILVDLEMVSEGGDRNTCGELSERTVRRNKRQAGDTRRVRVKVRSPRMAARRLNWGYMLFWEPVLKGEPAGWPRRG